MNLIKRPATDQITGTRDGRIAQLTSPKRVNQLLGSPDIETSDRPVFGHRKVDAGDYLVRAGDEFHDLYIVNGGYFKTILIDDSGNEQIMAFPIKGCLIGADGMGTHSHVNDVIALTDADVIVVPFNDLSVLKEVAPRIEESIFRSISQQLIDEQLAVASIGSLSAETRLARFLASTGDRMSAQGYSRDVFVLQMSRRDIGNYLGMKIETVSRTLSAMVKKGVIGVEQREIRIANRDALDKIARGDRGASSTQPTSSSKPLPQVTPVRSQARDQTSRTSAAVTPWSGLIDVVGLPENAVA